MSHGAQEDLPEVALITGCRASQMKSSHRAADRLQREILDRAHRAPSSLGSTAEIQQRYGLGRWACREAIGILELRGVGELRSGRGGGLIPASPSLEDLARLMLLHLYMKRATTTELIEARRLIYLAALRQVMTRPNHRCDDETLFPGDVEPRCSPIGDWLAHRSRNAATKFLVELVDTVCATYANLEEPVQRRRSRSDTRAVRTTLQRAIADGDAETAHRALVDHLADSERLLADSAIVIRQIPPGWCSTGKARSARNLAMHLLKEIVEGADKTTFGLGSELEVGLRHDANPMTVRHAIRLLEDLALVAPRRGRFGGLTSRRPTVTSIIGLFPHVLVQGRLSIFDCFEAAGMLDIETAKFAAENRSTKGARAGTAKAPPKKPSQPKGLIAIEYSTSELLDNSILTACERGFLMYACMVEPVVRQGAVPDIVDERLLSLIQNVADRVAAGDPIGAEAAARERYGLLALRFEPAQNAD